MIAREKVHAGLSEVEVVADLAERKRRMFARSRQVLVLPGGTGTLDELLDAITMRRLGANDHRIALIDVGGYFRPLLAALRNCVMEGFAEPAQLKLFSVVASVDDALQWLSE